MDIDRLINLPPEEQRRQLQNMSTEERLRFAERVASNLNIHVARVFPQGAALVARGQSISTVDYAAIAKREIDRIRAMR